MRRQPRVCAERCGARGRLKACVAMASLETLGAYVARDIRNQVSDDARALLAAHLTDTVTAWITTRATREAQALRKFQSEAKQGEGDVGLDILVNCALT